MKNNIIQEDYVSFEIAKLLEEKGFDEYCRAEWLEYIDGPSKGKTYLTECGSGLQHNSCSNTSLKKFNYDGQMYYAAPTLQMAMKWLREKHKIFIAQEFGWFHGDYEYQVSVIKMNLTIPPTLDSVHYIKDLRHKTCEGACEKAIKYCLTHLI